MLKNIDGAMVVFGEKKSEKCKKKIVAKGFLMKFWLYFCNLAKNYG
jgi:hypothetical protein